MPPDTGLCFHNFVFLLLRKAEKQPRGREVQGEPRLPHGPWEAGPLGPSSSDFSIHHLRAGGTFETKTPRSSGIAGESEAWAGGVRLTVAQPPGRSRGGVSVRTRPCVHASVRISVHGAAPAWGGGARHREPVFPFADHPRESLDFAGGTEEKWISQVNEPVLKTF